MNSPGVIVSCCYSEGRPGYYEKYADRLEASLAERVMMLEAAVENARRLYAPLEER